MSNDKIKGMILNDRDFNRIANECFTCQETYDIFVQYVLPNYSNSMAEYLFSIFSSYQLQNFVVYPFNGMENDGFNMLIHEVLGENDEVVHSSDTMIKASQVPQFDKQMLIYNSNLPSLTPEQMDQFLNELGFFVMSAYNYYGLDRLLVREQPFAFTLLMSGMFFIYV